MQTRTKIAAISLSAVALAGVVGVGISYADDPTASPSASAPTSAAPRSAPSRQPQRKGEHAKRTLLLRALHGEVTVGGKKTRVIVFQRGTAAKVSATSITITSSDDFTQTYLVTEGTRIRQAGEAGEIADIKIGDKVRVVALKEGDTSTARVIGEPRS